jgi:hypothetical protein
VNAPKFKLDSRDILIPLYCTEKEDRGVKYLRNFKKRSKLTKNSDFFARGERATLSHQFEQRQYFNRANFSVNILQFLKDAVITVGVSFRLCSSFSVLYCCLSCKSIICVLNLKSNFSYLYFLAINEILSNDRAFISAPSAEWGLLNTNRSRIFRALRVFEACLVFYVIYYA